MRLLNTFTLEVEEFLQRDVPEYVILSHFWQEEEVTLSDIQSGVASSKLGYSKLESCAKKAFEDGFAFCWVDTCCIDKTSSAELSEALNSMYQWYQNARICYAYLADFEINSNDVEETYQSFARSRWFTRGWTLQELIAPVVVEFYSKDWQEFGTRLSLQDRLADITGITKFVLRGGEPSFCEVAVRMSWAANRRTTRVEDEAYCLMGLFSVNMPLLYGEGTRAFRRLQEEILRVDEDYTLFAWYPKQRTRLEDAHPMASKGLFAKSPQDFSDFTLKAAGGLDGLEPTLTTWRREDLSMDCSPVFSPPSDYVPPHLTSRGLRIMLPLLEYAPREYYMCLTLITPNMNEVYLLCITLRCPITTAKEKRYIRDGNAVLVVLPRAISKRFKYTSIYVDQPFDELGKPSTLQQSWNNNQIPSFLLVKVGSLLTQHLKSKFSGLTSLQYVLEAWLRSIGPESESQSRDEEILDSIYANYKDTPQFQAFVEMFVGMSRDELITLSMGDPTTCYVTDSDPAHNVIGFTFKNVDVGFWVYVSLGDRPSCEIIPADFEELDFTQMEKKMRDRKEQQGMNALQRTDRATILLNQRATAEMPDAALRPLQITVSVRRVASARDAGDHVRYMLSLKQTMSLPKENLTLAIHSAKSSLEHTGSWQQISRISTDASQ